MEKLQLSNYPQIFDEEIHLPSSKSLSNRLLIIKALSKIKFDIKNLSKANDTVLLKSIIDKLHINPPKEKPIIIDAEDAGTTFRFLTAFLSTVKGEFILTGSQRMQERPIKILVDALIQLGADITYLVKEGYPPLHIKGAKLSSNAIHIDSSVSSQYISSLLLISPTLPQGIELHLSNTTSSLPYIDMTINLMKKYGICINREKQSISIEKGDYVAAEYSIEPDWSAAAFWYQCVSFSTNGQLLLKGLSKGSLQGDSIISKLFELLGVESYDVEQGILIKKERVANKNIRVDFRDYPDIAIPFIAACAGLSVIGQFTGLESLKIKESNRILALENELAKLGFDFRESSDNEWVLLNSCKANPQQFDFSNISISTYNDHRIAMGFAPFAVLGNGITIENPEVVNKSFPGFWDEFIKLQ